MISAQLYRNAYEKFFNDFRMYLWPYKVLEDLADIEVEIYTAFPDVQRLKLLIERFRNHVRETMSEDENLKKSFEELSDIIHGEKDTLYVQLHKVEEVNPDEDKQIKTEQEEDSESESATEGTGFSASF